MHAVKHFKVCHCARKEQVNTHPFPGQSLSSWVISNRPCTGGQSLWKCSTFHAIPGYNAPQYPWWLVVRLVETTPHHPRKVQSECTVLEPSTQLWQRPKYYAFPLQEQCFTSDWHPWDPTYQALLKYYMAVELATFPASSWLCWSEGN